METSNFNEYADVISKVINGLNELMQLDCIYGDDKRMLAITRMKRKLLQLDAEVGNEKF